MIFSSVFLLSLHSGCVRTRAYQYSDAPVGQALLNPLPNFRDADFLAKWSQPVSEPDKIRYLLERVASSTNPFLRNGGTYNGKVARQWLLFKTNHWVSGVETADDFIVRVASFSQKTGKPYLVEIPPGKIYSLRSVLQNELAAFENFQAQIKALPSNDAAPKPSQGIVAQAPLTKTQVV